MAAVTYQSAGVSPGADSTSIVITAPANIAVGDMLVAGLHWNGTGTITPETGWALITGADLLWQEGANNNIEVYWKVADADDAAAANFTFTISAQAENVGAMLRLTNAAPSADAFSTPTTDTEDTGGGATVNPAAQTFTTDEWLCVIVGGSADDNTWTFSVAGSNQTLTERVDTAAGAGAAQSVGIATVAPDSGQSNLSTGTITCTVNTSSDGPGAIAFMVKPTTSASVSLDVLSVPVVVNSPSPDVTQPLDVLSIPVVLNDPTSTTEDNPWSNTGKNTASATNTAKNDATAANTAKSSAPTWSNEQKT